MENLQCKNFFRPVERDREGGRGREGGMGGRIAATSMVVVCTHPEYVHVLLKSPSWKIVLSLSEGVMLI